MTIRTIIALCAVASLYGCGGDDGISKERDPRYSASPSASITTDDINNWNAAVSATEADPVFSASTAAGITQTDVDNWNVAASGLGPLTTNTVPVWDGTTLTNSSIKESGGKIGIAADVSTTAKVTVPTARFGSYVASDTVKNCPTPGFSWTHTPPSANACNTYCTDRGFEAGRVSADGSRPAAGATCDYISNFETCAISSMSNTGCNSRAASFNCTCQKLATELTSDVRVTGGDMQLGGYLQLGQTAGQPPAADCDAVGEYGRMLTDPATGYLWVCSSSGWNAK